MFKFLVVLCLGVLAVQAKPQLKDPIDDLSRELEGLEREAEEEQHRSFERLEQELKGLDDLSQQLEHGLEEALHRDVGILEDQIKELEDRAREARVDIQQCVGDSQREIGDLPDRVLEEARHCFNDRHGEAQREADGAREKIEGAAKQVEDYRRDLDRCRDAGRQDQDICVSQLENEIRRDAIEIPALFRLATEEAVGAIEIEKTQLLECVTHREGVVLEEGGHIVERVTDCADRILPPGPGPNPPQ